MSEASFQSQNNFSELVAFEGDAMEGIPFFLRNYENVYIKANRIISYRIVSYRVSGAKQTPGVQLSRHFIQALERPNAGDH